VRPPQGAATLGSLARCARAGFTTVLWSLDSDDCRDESPAALAARLGPERVSPGEIVLLHEGQRWTLEALPAILGGLRDAGYALVTVSELLGL
jgi:peptidoglycan/xylan/chitin deacetylase (PgdA/CDA1 family)